MKNKLAIIACTLAVLAVGAGIAERSRRHEVVILHSYQHTRRTALGLEYVGQVVYSTSRSTNAPVFPQYIENYGPQLIEVAEAVAQLMSDGYHIVKVSDNMQDYILSK